MVRTGWFGIGGVAVAVAVSCGGQTAARDTSTDSKKDGGTGGATPAGSGGGPSGRAGRAGANAGGTGGIILDANSEGVAPDLDGGCAVAVPPTERFSAAEVIFALQNSESMKLEAGFFESSLNSFARKLLDAGLDTRVAIVSDAAAPGVSSNGVCVPPPLGSGQCPGDSNPPVYLHVADPVGNHDALTKLISNYPNYNPILRASSIKYFVVISDSDARTHDRRTIRASHRLDAWGSAAAVPRRFLHRQLRESGCVSRTGSNISRALPASTRDCLRSLPGSEPAVVRCHASSAGLDDPHGL